MSRGLGDVYKRQTNETPPAFTDASKAADIISWDFIAGYGTASAAVQVGVYAKIASYGDVALAGTTISVRGLPAAPNSFDCVTYVACVKGYADVASPVVDRYGYASTSNSQTTVLTSFNTNTNNSLVIAFGAADGADMLPVTVNNSFTMQSSDGAGFSSFSTAAFWATLSYATSGTATGTTTATWRTVDGVAGVHLEVLSLT
mgnify:CR=1 FL=1